MPRYFHPGTGGRELVALTARENISAGNARHTKRKRRIGRLLVAIGEAAVTLAQGFLGHEAKVNLNMIPTFNVANIHIFFGNTVGFTKFGSAAQGAGAQGIFVGKVGNAIGKLACLGNALMIDVPKAQMP